MTVRQALVAEWPDGKSSCAVADADLTSRLRASIGRLARRLNASTDDRIGLTPTQVSVLGVVVRRGPLGLTELAEIEGVNPTMLSRVVGRLVDVSLLERATDADNRRAALVTATPTGREVHGRIRDERTAALTEALRRLPPAEAATVLESVGAFESLARELAAVNAERRMTL